MGVKHHGPSGQWMAFTYATTRTRAIKFVPIGYYDTEGEAEAAVESYQAAKYMRAVRKRAPKKKVPA